MRLEEKHLWIVNQALERNPELAIQLERAIRDLFPNEIVPAVPVPEEPKPAIVRTAEEYKVIIRDWFISHRGKHSLREVASDLHVQPENKTFMRAVRELRTEGELHFSGKRGVGAEYWRRDK